MNVFLVTAFVLGGGTIAVNRFVRELPHWLAIVLYSIAVALFVTGMAVRSKAGV